MTRYCDLVMKGGITSGVVYPLAAVELQREYRFRKLGGTSAGAIAAAAIAAAEHGKRTGRGSAYAGIETLPGWLGTNLISLFQPSRRMRPILGLMLSASGHSPLRTLIAAPSKTPIAAGIGAIPGLALIASVATKVDWPLNLLTDACGLLLVLVGVLTGTVVSLAFRALGLPGHYFGLCTGSDEPDQAPSPALTRWLADLLDDAAGKQADQPLTFGDLWRLPEPDQERGIDLKMITTSLTHGRPYVLPFEEHEFWFRVSEFRDLFPPRIVDWLTEHAAPREEPVTDPDLVRLPAAADLPVVVAARMSLSFPLLISAVPLHAINYERRPVNRNLPERCWFSDGGITSNFPVHFFDSPVPRWPTFAIDLLPMPKGRNPAEGRIWMPNENGDGGEERWTIWDPESSRAQIVGFGSSIFRTAQNWLDNRQMRVQGYRDRIAHIYLDEHEGGMNLDMKHDAVTRIAGYGVEAAALLRHRFSIPVPSDEALTWENQRWLRFRTFMQLLEEAGARFRDGYDDPQAGGRTMAELAGRPANTRPPGYAWERDAQRAVALTAVEELRAMLDRWHERGSIFDEGAPRPVPNWRIMAPM